MATTMREIAAMVAVRRREWERQAGEDHFEDLPAHDRRWLAELDDAATVLRESLVGEREIDPRAAAIDLLAVATALVEQMG